MVHVTPHLTPLDLILYFFISTNCHHSLCQIWSKYLRKKHYVKRFTWVSRDPLLEFWDPQYLGDGL